MKYHIRLWKTYNYWIIDLSSFAPLELKLYLSGSSHCGAAETDLTNIHEDVGSDPALLQLCCRLVAIALIQPQAWELQYAAGAAQKNEKTKQNEKQKKKKNICLSYILVHYLICFSPHNPDYEKIKASGAYVKCLKWHF